MKIYIYIIAILLLSSCSEWLDVTPRSETQDKEHFSHEEGFKSVLMGVYIRMASETLYGTEMTMSFTELLAQHWDTSSNGDKKNRRYANTSSFKYKETDVEDLIYKIWKEYYTSIANLNNIIAQIDAKKEIFSTGNYELIKGEAYGLRAFLHFDLLRLFGPIPLNAKSDDMAIPYVTEVTKKVEKLTSKTYSQVVQSILQDLDLAETLLANDPLVKGNNVDLNNPGGYDSQTMDDFLYYRQYRFNLYAVKATKARVYLWQGNKILAKKYAQQIVDAEKFRLAKESDLITEGKEDRTFTAEHIFALHQSKLANIITPLFRSGSDVFGRSKNSVKKVFETDQNPEDIRSVGTRYWEDRVVFSTQKKYCYKKYYQDVESDPNVSQVIPLVRLSEMYLILMESSTLDEALIPFQSFRISRKMNSTLDIGFVDQESLMSRIEKEYPKEFMAEGQTFYFYKRLNKTKIMGTKGQINVTMGTNTYVVPKPQGQLVFE